MSISDACQALNQGVLDCGISSSVDLQIFRLSEIDQIATSYRQRHELENTQELAATFRELLGKWVALTRGIDNPDDLAALYWEELYSKVDVSSYGL